MYYRQPRPRLIGIVGVLLVTAYTLISGPVPSNKPEAYPDWWFERDVIPLLLTAPTRPEGPLWPDDYPPADDYAVVNQGQAKHLAKQAYEELSATLPFGTGSALDALWANPATGSDDYMAVNLGQLKNMAEPFYELLEQLDYAGQPLGTGQTRPWSGTADDYSIANIGQVKNLFSFDVTGMDFTHIDLDQDGLPDAWEYLYWSSLSHAGEGDVDGDGISNYIEFLQGRNPTKGVVDGVDGGVGLKVYAPGK